MELMYPKQDAAVVCVNLMLLPNVDWLQFSVCRRCCRPSNAVSKGMAGATALASPKGEGKDIHRADILQMVERLCNAISCLVCLDPYRHPFM